MPSAPRLLVVLAALAAHAAAPPATATGQVASAPAQATGQGAAPTWSVSASVYTYLLPDEGNYAQPTLAADRDALHLEARYNYEALDTASAWAGYNFEGGQAITWAITPMLGGVFGDTTGIAPGYKGSLGWWKLELYSEGEYVFDTGESSDSFFYNWSELSIAPVEWLRAGVVTQRTRAYRSDRDIQRGLLVGVTYRQLDVTAYVLNPDESTPTAVIALVLGF